MEQQFTNGPRRNEDIALDLLKLIVSTTQVARTTTGSTGFGVSHSPKSDDQVASLLDLYSRCLSTVTGK